MILKAKYDQEEQNRTQFTCALIVIRHRVSLLSHDYYAVLAHTYMPKSFCWFFPDWSRLGHDLPRLSYNTTNSYIFFLSVQLSHSNENVKNGYEEEDGNVLSFSDGHCRVGRRACCRVGRRALRGAGAGGVDSIIVFSTVFEIN